MDKIDPNDAIDFMIANSKKYAQAKANRTYLEEFRKSMKAELCKEALVAGFEAVNAQEREAYSHPDYKEHLMAIKAAIEEEERLRWLMVAAQARIDVWRSMEASNRMIDKAAL
jgi:ATP-dependent DNA ligase